MSSKKVTSEKLSIQITPIDLSRSITRKHFSASSPDDILIIRQGFDSIGYLAIEYLHADIVQAHIYIHHHKRSHKVFKALRDNMMNTLSPYMKVINKRKFMVSCPENLPNTKKFLELLGFSMQTIHYGVKDFT